MRNSGFNILFSEFPLNAANIIKLQQYLDTLPDNIETELNTAKTEIAGNMDQKFEAFKLSLNNTFLSSQGVNQQLKYLSKDLDRKINRTLASQGALANLFQPYKVGKLNLTAAVGGYKSEYALAIGTGYRFNENVAARASLSFVKGGSTVYGAGVNFEY